MPVTFPGGFAADGRPESARPYPAGQEKASNANANLAKQTDLADARDKSK